MNGLAHITGPVLTTERLTLRMPVMADSMAHAAFYGSDASAFVGGPISGHDAWRAFSSIAGHWAMSGFGWFTLERRDTGTVIGMCGVHHPPRFADREIGWMLFDARGEGFASEAAQATRDWAQANLPPAPLVSYIDPENTASQAVARRLGASTDGTRAAHDAGCEVWSHPVAKSATGRADIMQEAHAQ